MDKPKVLITEPLPLLEEDTKALAPYANVMLASSSGEEVLCKEIVDADLLMVVYAKVSSLAIDSAPKLRSIVRCGIGVDNIDVAAATARKIVVVNVPDYAIETVADHALTLILLLARKIIRADHAMRMKSWGTWTSPPRLYRGIDLGGKTLGLVGLGRIGRALARRAQPFNMNLLAFDPYVRQDELAGTSITLTNLERLLRESDFVSIHAALTPETRGMIGEQQLRMMKNNAYLVNTSRGGLIQEKALIGALKEGRIAGAGLDVYEQEPPSLDNPLFEMDNVVLTPHIAWYTDEALRRLENLAVQRAIELLQGKIPKTVVNPDALK